jgi:hypothetical protein
MLQKVLAVRMWLQTRDIKPSTIWVCMSHPRQTHCTSALLTCTDIIQSITKFFTKFVLFTFILTKAKRCRGSLNLKNISVTRLHQNYDSFRWKTTIVWLFRRKHNSFNFLVKLQISDSKYCNYVKTLYEGNKRNVWQRPLSIWPVRVLKSLDNT